MIEKLCPSLANSAAVVYEEIKNGKSLSQILEVISANGEPVAGSAFKKVANYVWQNKEKPLDAIRKSIDADCAISPRSFFLLQGSEIQRYRVVGSPSLSDKTETVSSPQHPAPVDRTNNERYEEEVRKCFVEATRDQSLTKGISASEIEAVCRTGLK